MKRYMELVAEALKHVDELFPWDLEEELKQDRKRLLLYVREPYEFDQLHIQKTLNVPRGILEQSCEAGFEESQEVLIDARDDTDIIIICRSGYRSALAARSMQILGFGQVRSLKTGIRGWNDYELPLFNHSGSGISSEDADDILAAKPPI